MKDAHHKFESIVIVGNMTEKKQVVNPMFVVRHVKTNGEECVYLHSEHFDAMKIVDQ